jgi:Major Facilitator Superfamily
MPTDPADGTPGSNAYRRLFHNAAYVRVFSAGLGSVAGSSIAGVCLVWIVYTGTGSALDVGLLAASFLAGSIAFSVGGGALADRYDRRRLMIGSDVARALALVVVVVDLDLRGLDLPTIFAAYFVIAAFTTIFQPCEQALVPSIVEGPLVAEANGLVRSSRSILQFVGVAVGGLLIVTIGPVAGIAVNAATFGASALLLTGMVVPRPAGGGGIRTGYWAEIRAGFAWLGRAKGFLHLTLSATFFNFCSSLIATFIVVYSATVLHGSAFTYASLVAAEVGGYAVGPLLVSRTHAVRWAGRAWAVPYGVLSGLGVLVLVAAPDFPVSVAAMFALGALSGFAGTAWLTAAQLLVPGEMQGRYFGIDNLGSVAILPVAQIGGAFLIAGVGVREAYLLTGLVWVGAGLAFLGSRPMWRLGYPPHPEDRASYRSAAGASGTPGSRAGTRSA